MNIYPQTLLGIAAFINVLDGAASTLVENDMGVVLGAFPLYSTDGHLIGAVNYDSDQHPYFTPSDTSPEDYDEPF